MKTVEDFLISEGELNIIYKSEVKLCLCRSLNNQYIILFAPILICLWINF